MKWECEVLGKSAAPVSRCGCVDWLCCVQMFPLSLPNDLHIKSCRFPVVNLPRGTGRTCTAWHRQHQHKHWATQPTYYTAARYGDIFSDLHSKLLYMKSLDRNRKSMNFIGTKDIIQKIYISAWICLTRLHIDIYIAYTAYRYLDCI